MKDVALTLEPGVLIRHEGVMEKARRMNFLEQSALYLGQRLTARKLYSLSMGRR